MEEWHSEYCVRGQGGLAKVTGSGGYSEGLNEKVWDKDWYAARKTLAHDLPRRAREGRGRDRREG